MLLLLVSKFYKFPFSGSCSFSSPFLFLCMSSKSEQPVQAKLPFPLLLALRRQGRHIPGWLRKPVLYF